MVSECYLCGSQTSEFHIIPDKGFGNNDFGIFRCNHCQLLQLSNPPENLDPYYVDYDPHSRYFFQLSPIKQVFIRTMFFLYSHVSVLRFKEWIFGIFVTKRKGRILDYGCGSGVYMSMLDAKKWEKYSADMFDPDEAFKKYNKDINYTNITKESLPDGISYDVIRMNHVLEHLKDPEKVLRNLSSKLKENGEIVIAVPNGDSIGYLKKKYGLWDAPRHLFWFNEKNLKQLIEKVGLKTVMVRKSSSTGLMYGMILQLDQRFHLLASFLSILLSPLLYLCFGEADAIHLYAKKTDETLIKNG
ncbi:MAG: class I SAM-dependent methyltransferase [Pseudomonadota bacterium]